MIPPDGRRVSMSLALGGALVVAMALAVVVRIREVRAADPATGPVRTGLAG